MILRGLALQQKKVMPPAIEEEIERLAPGESPERLSRLVHYDPSSLARITRVSLQHLRGDVRDFTHWPAVNPHPYPNLTMNFDRLTDFNRTPQRRLDSIAKNQRHPVPCGNPHQHAVRVGRTELRSVSYDFIERLESFALVGDQKLGIANDVDQQNVANLQLEI